MASGNLEIESKFWVSDLARIEANLIAVGAVVVEIRAFESNIRFDTQDSSYTRDRKVVRLRKYHDNRLTYKGPGEIKEGALSRVEIETVVSDHENTRLILHALGFEERAVYEKYRAMYEYKGSLVTLDELPYGNFIEIEGTTPTNIAEIARILNLQPERAIPASYQGIFEQLRAKFGLNAENLTFEEVHSKDVDLKALGFQQADQPQ